MWESGADVLPGLATVFRFENEVGGRRLGVGGRGTLGGKIGFGDLSGFGAIPAGQECLSDAKQGEEVNFHVRCWIGETMGQKYWGGVGERFFFDLGRGTLL